VKTNRTQLRKALDKLKTGDVLMVARLAWSTHDLFNTLAIVAEKRLASGFLVTLGPIPPQRTRDASRNRS
jgi:DNA invertase Pin-like site-specific DNA recombinase